MLYRIDGSLELDSPHERIRLSKQINLSSANLARLPASLKLAVAKAINHSTWRKVSIGCTAVM